MNHQPSCLPHFLWALLGLFSASGPIHAATEAVVGDVRVQALSPTLVRIEQKGPQGFEDRKTLTVVNRDWAGIPLKTDKKDGKVLLTTSAYQVEIPQDARDLDGVILRSASGEELHTISPDDLKFDYLPAPGKMPRVWVLPDSPRVVPPEWGATPAPDSSAGSKESSGWEMDAKARDIYFFIPQPEKYAAFRQEFLSLTGPVPMPPLYAFGLWFSRYWPYTEEESLSLMDEFRKRGFPFDVLVCDTDWRVGASTGYGVNEKLFPDMARYISRAHEKNVRVVFNDHPEPQAVSAWAPEELSYREKGLNSLLSIGADAWWYDKNWNKHLNVPEGLSIEFWGMVVYHDLTMKLQPDRRPLIMSNVDGIWNGVNVGPSNPASHRYPIWWTGDTLAFWEDLRAGINNGVDGGIERMMPYINEDLGGHVLEATPDQYIRWFQFGSFSPLPRPHSYPKVARLPWVYGETSEKICRDYMQLRYRLLPTIYTAVREAYDNGTPLLKRCDLEWPQHPEAADGLQYLFGRDLLVAPQCYSGLDPLPLSLLKTPEGKKGIRAEYFDNMKFEGTPRFVRTGKEVSYNFKIRPRGLPKDNVSVRWTGTLGPIKETAEYEFGVISRDGSKVWIGDTEVLSFNKPLKKRHDLEVTTGRIRLEAGKSYPIKVEFWQKADGEFSLSFGSIKEIEDRDHQTRSLWIPPGRWQDAWTGESLEGPKTITVTSDLEHTPMYVREGGMVVSTPLRMHTGVPMWDGLVVDAFVTADAATSEREVYEDDGLSNGYLDKKFSRTKVFMKTEAGKSTLKIEPAVGDFLPKDFKRNWTLRLHLPAGMKSSEFSVNGKAIQTGDKANETGGVVLLKPAKSRVFPFGGVGAAPGEKSGEVAEFSVSDYPADKVLTIGVSLERPGSQP